MVGLPLNRDPDAPVSIQSDVVSRPFHLFFPTKIASGTPFLLHGYFEVAAGRAGFYHGSDDRNRLILDRLTDLVAVAIADAVAEGVSSERLAQFLGEAAPAEDLLAELFRAQTLVVLDEVAWVTDIPHPSVPNVVSTTSVSAFRPALLE